MNYMSQVAKMLGVEIGEEFDIPGCIYNPYKLIDGGLIDTNGGTGYAVFLDLIKEERTIQKRPWKPKEGEGYHYFRVDGVLIRTYLSACSTLDRYNLTNGNCFYSQKEARANEDKALKALGLTEWIE